MLLPLTIILAIAIFLPGAVALFIAPGNPNVASSLPRNRIIGVALALTALLWAAHEAEVMLEGDLARLIPLLNILAVVVAFLAYFFLGYLFTRAIAGLTLLLVTQILLEAFIVRLPARPVFSALCYAVALAAMVLVAQPWIFRELLERSAQSQSFRTRAFAISTILATTFVAFAVLGTFQ